MSVHLSVYVSHVNISDTKQSRLWLLWNANRKFGFPFQNLPLYLWQKVWFWLFARRKLIDGHLIVQNLGAHKGNSDIKLILNTTEHFFILFRSPSVTVRRRLFGLKPKNRTSFFWFWQRWKHHRWNMFSCVWCKFDISAEPTYGICSIK